MHWKHKCFVILDSCDSGPLASPAHKIMVLFVSD